MQQSEASGSWTTRMPTQPYEVAPSHPLPQTPFYSVEYPGFVGQSESSISAAIATLGGQASLDYIFKRPKAKILELRLRPDDVFAHPIPGEVVGPGTGGTKLLLKVTKRKRRKKTEKSTEDSTAADAGSSMLSDPTVQNNPSPDTTWEDERHFTAQVVGTMPKCVRFRAIADYQYTPNPSDPMIRLRQSFEDLDAETIKLIQNFKFGPELEDYSLPLPPEEAVKAEVDRSLPKSKSNLRLPPPPIFMRSSLPSLYNYKPNPFSVVQTITNEETGEERQRLINKTRFKGFGALAVDFNDRSPVPAQPAEHMEKQRTSVNSVLLTRVLELLDERPVWSRVALLNQFSLNERREIFNSKAIIPLASYSFSDGPFRDSYVRFGYDPRQHIEARFYQRVTFRNAGHHFRRRPLIVPGEKNELSQAHIFETSHIFDGKIAKYEVSPGFQLCDIHDPLLKGMIEDESGLRENGECHERDGFYTAAAYDRIKAVLKRKLTGLIEEGRVVPDSECADIMARETTIAKTGNIKEVRLAHPYDGKAKRNRAKHIQSPEEAVAARLRAAVKRQGASSRLSSEEEDDDGDDDNIP